MAQGDEELDTTFVQLSKINSYNAYPTNTTIFYYFPKEIVWGGWGGNCEDLKNELF
jgi:hypothetical protein